MSAPERLQKVLARAGVGSRRQVEEMIREGRVTVNGAVATLGQRADLGSDAVKVDGRRIAEPAPERRYVLLNKPAGVVTTRADPEGRPTVIELLPPRFRGRLRPVGRLDFDTEGLLILTDDGDFAQRVAHPRHGCVKTYEVKVKGRPADEAIARLKKGVMLGGRRAAPISIAARRAPPGPRESVSNSWWTIRLGEGRTRQVREMFFRIGHPVSRLRRVAIGPVADPKLPKGAWRELTDKEVDLLRHARPAGKSGTPGRPGKTAPSKAKRGGARTKTRGPEARKRRPTGGGRGRGGSGARGGGGG